MKKIIKSMAILGAVTVTAATTAFCLGLSKAAIKASDFIAPKFYPLTSLVTEVNGDLITVTCQNGNIFQFEDDREDWVKGDICSMIMTDCGTKNVNDDIVVDVRCSGYVSSGEADNWVK